MQNRTAVIAAICGGVVGLAIGLPAKFYLLDPYLASLSTTQALTHESRQVAENIRRDQLVADSIEKLAESARKAACDGYLGGLKEQGLAISSTIRNACSGS